MCDFLFISMQQLSSEVALSDNVGAVPGSPLSVRYFSRCLDSSGPMHQTSSCSNIKEGDEIEFLAQIEVSNRNRRGRIVTRHYMLN